MDEENEKQEDDETDEAIKQMQKMPGQAEDRVRYLIFPII